MITNLLRDIKLKSGDIWPFEKEYDYSIQVPTREISVTRMLEEVERKIVSSQAEFSKQFIDIAPWGNGYSLRNLLLEGEPVFDETSGAPLLDSTCLISSSLFNEPAFYVQHSGIRRETRGPRYYLSLDRASWSSVEKLAFLETTFERIALIIQEQTDSSFDRESYLAYLGALDYLKHFALMLNRYLTFPERIGTLREDDTSYQEAKHFSEDLAERCVTGFYRTLLGHPHGIDLPNTREVLHRLVTYLKGEAQSLPDFDASEVDHPYKLLASALKTVRHIDNPETIVAIQSGGTQYGFVLQLVYKLMTGTSVRLAHMPLSVHASSFMYGKKEERTDFLFEWVKKQGIASGRCIIADDNSNTGTTLKMAQEALEATGLSDIRFSLIEWDPLRIISKTRSDTFYATPAEFVLNCFHPDVLATVSGHALVSYLGKEDYQTAQLKALYILYDYYTRKPSTQS